MIKVITLTIVACGLLLLPPRYAEAQRRQLPVFSNGSGSDPDRATANSQAHDNSERNLVCTGRLENVRTTVNCTRVGDGDSAQWFCSATSTGTCVL